MVGDEMFYIYTKKNRLIDTYESHDNKYIRYYGAIDNVSLEEIKNYYKQYGGISVISPSETIDDNIDYTTGDYPNIVSHEPIETKHIENVDGMPLYTYSIKDKTHFNEPPILEPIYKDRFSRKEYILEILSNYKSSIVEELTKIKYSYIYMNKEKTKFLKLTQLPEDLDEILKDIVRKNGTVIGDIDLDDYSKRSFNFTIYDHDQFKYSMEIPGIDNVKIFLNDIKRYYKAMDILIAYISNKIDDLINSVSDEPDTVRDTTPLIIGIMSNIKKLKLLDTTMIFTNANGYLRTVENGNQPLNEEKLIKRVFTPYEDRSKYGDYNNPYLRNYDKDIAWEEVVTRNGINIYDVPIIKTILST